MKLKQGQTWKCGEEFVRIVHLERLEVDYKSFKSLKSTEGTQHHVSKKTFCRMLKGATLLNVGERGGPTIAPVHQPHELKPHPPDSGLKT